MNNIGTKKPFSHTFLSRFVFTPTLLPFKNLFKHSRGKIARQTFVKYLQKAVEDDIVARREEGRTTYYRFNLNPEPEEETLKQWLNFVKQRLSYIPADVSIA